MLRNVLHDWNDAKTTDILRSLRTMMGAPTSLIHGPTPHETHTTHHRDHCVMRKPTAFKIRLRGRS